MKVDRDDRTEKLTCLTVKYRQDFKKCYDWQRYNIKVDRWITRIKGEL